MFEPSLDGVFAQIKQAASTENEKKVELCDMGVETRDNHKMANSIACIVFVLTL